jgi:hypothetical protein
MRFVPGKVYQSRDTQLKFLCIAETDWITKARRSMYYVLLRSNDGTTNWPARPLKWDYTPHDVTRYSEVKE